MQTSKNIRFIVLWDDPYLHVSALSRWPQHGYPRWARPKSLLRSPQRNLPL